MQHDEGIYFNVLPCPFAIVGRTALYSAICCTVKKPVSYTHLDVYKRQEKMVPMGFGFASSAVAMPLKPIAGRLVEFRGFHWPTLDR